MQFFGNRLSKTIFSVRHCLLLAALSLSLVACNSIGMKSDFDHANFQIGKTTKKEVLAYLGLPQQITKDAAGREHYLYEGATRLVGTCIGCGNTDGTVGIVPLLINNSLVKNGAEYVFDRDVLAAKFEPEK